MALKMSENLRNAILDAIESDDGIGTAPTLQIRTGTPPADCATAATGTLLVEITLPSDWLAGAASGSKAKSGTWQANASATGTAGYFRIKRTAATADTTNCQFQGTVTATGGGGDMTIDDADIVSGRTITVTAFTLTENYA